MILNDTEQTTKDILSVETRYTTKMVWFIVNFVCMDFWFEIK
jgi:hypothetical protein